MSAAATGSRPAVGSSQKIQSGSCSVARISATFWAMPREYAASTVSARSASSKRSSSSAMRFFRTPAGTPYRNPKWSRYSGAVLRPYSRAWSGTTPSRERTSFNASGRRKPSSAMVPASGRRIPPRQRSVVDLPAPFWPSSTRISPWSTVRSTPSTARTSAKLLRRPSTRIILATRSDLFERIHWNDENSSAADLHLHRVRHEELARLRHRRHRSQVAAALAAVLADHIHRLGNPRVLDANEKRHVPLLQEAAARSHARGCDTRRGQSLRGALCILALDHGDHELQLAALPASARSTRSITAAWTCACDSVPSTTV